jgi:dCMP deaminase
MKALVVYIPVIHKGILDLCERQKPDHLYILGQSLKNDFPLLERDIRALSPEKIATEAKALSLATEVFIIEKETLSKLDSYEVIAITEDEVGEELYKRYFSDKKVVVDTAFIRWNGIKALSKSVPTASQIISSEEFDLQCMGVAMKEAQKSPDWWRQVGSVIVKNGEIIFSGYNKHKPTEQTSYINGDPRSNFDAGKNIEVSIALHGEAGLIATAAREGISLQGASIYVTTFPCPNCAMLIMQSGIKKVYYKDGYSLLHAEEMFQSAGIEIVQVL